MDQSPQNPPKPPEYQIDKFALQAKVENLKMEQNLPLGILGALAGGFLGAILWALVTYFTDYQIGWLAIGIGFLAGFGNRALGKGIDRIFGIAGALIALFSVVLGNFLFSIALLAKYFEVSFFEMLLGFNYAMTFELFRETFTLMDLLFYALAIYTGYRYSFRRISKAELFEGAVVKTG